MSAPVPPRQFKQPSNHCPTCHYELLSRHFIEGLCPKCGFPIPVEAMEAAR